MTTISEPTTRVLQAQPLMLIDDEWVPAQSAEQLPVIDPATELEITTLASGGTGDVDRAVVAARRSFEDGAWRTMPPATQTRLMLALADAIEADVALLSELETVDGGKPIALSRQEILQAADFVRYYAGWPTKIYGTYNPTGPDVLSYTAREPIGVVAGIAPWNCPLINAVYKVAPAIACGNSVILKPAEQTSLTALRLGQMCLDVGIPPGVVQVLTGYGETVGDALVTHPDVDKIAFTGSTETGRIIARRGADQLKKISLELGGKGAALIFADADIEAAVNHLFSPYGVWYASGQICVQASRLLVQDSIRDEFIAAVLARTAQLRLGDTLDEATELGPLVSAEQLDRVLGYLQIAVDEGATALVGGQRAAGRGYYVEPTVLTGMKPQMRIAQEEIFGPVIGVTGFATEDEALAIANGTQFGLAMSVWTSNVSRAHHLARQLKSGVVWINSFADTDSSVAFGGVKQSGYGRECGEESIHTYTQTKSVYCRLNPLWG
jgi:acyl-CoA reductase-like NAD-dependent aldehyde dehydrogenase